MRSRKKSALRNDNISGLSLGGSVCKTGYFQLPVKIPHKSMKNITSKKRAEYRRRYELPDCLTERY